MIREHPRFQQHRHHIRLRGHDDAPRSAARLSARARVDYVPVPVVPELLRAKVKVFVDLYRKTRQLERFNAELEQRVLERTAELQRFNEELEQRIEERTRERETALAQLFEAQKMDTIGQSDRRRGARFQQSADGGARQPLAAREAAAGRSRNAGGCCKTPCRARSAARRSRSACWRSRAARSSSPKAVDFAALVSGMEELLKRALGTRSRALVCNSRRACRRCWWMPISSSWRSSISR